MGAYLCNRAQLTLFVIYSIYYLLCNYIPYYGIVIVVVKTKY